MKSVAPLKRANQRMTGDGIGVLFPRVVDVSNDCLGPSAMMSFIEYDDFVELISCLKSRKAKYAYIILIM